MSRAGAALSPWKRERLGRGGVSSMARITGLGRSTIYHGLCDVRDNVAAAPGRIRKPGG
jgi:hypothetical protein